MKNKINRTKTKAMATVTALAFIFLLVSSSFANLVSAETIDAISEENNKVSISLRPTEQRSLDGTADYELVIKDLRLSCAEYLRNNGGGVCDASVRPALIYKLSFDAQKMSGEFSEDRIYIHEGKTETVKLSVKTENIGKNIFSVILTEENPEDFSENYIGKLVTKKVNGVLIVGEETKPQPNKYFSISLTPEAQKSIDGTAVYKVILTDNRQPKTCQDYYGNPCFDEINETDEKLYNLYFKPETRMVGELETTTVSLNPGETKSIALNIKEASEGTNIFIVGVENADDPSSDQYVKGLLVVGERDNNPPEQATNVFNGEGFAINDKESDGYLVDLHFLDQDNRIKGKIRFDQKEFYIDGTIDQEKIQFSIFTENNKNREGHFSGEIKSFNNFLLLEGDLYIAEEKFTLTAFSKEKRIFRAIQPTRERMTEQTQLDEVFTITDETKPSEERETYVRPTEIRKSKIFGFIPNPFGKKVLEVEVIENGIVTKTQVKEFEKTDVGNYEVEVGSLQDETNIEVSITKK